MSTTDSTEKGKDYCGDLVRRLDPDRYFAALFASVPERSELLALYAFNLELAQVWESVSEPVLGEIRFQWWRDALAPVAISEGSQHPVVSGLLSALTHGRLDKDQLMDLIDGRRRDLDGEPLQDLPALIAYAEQTGGALCRLAVSVLGAGDDPDITGIAVDTGTAWALLGLIRSVPFHASRGKSFLPQAISGNVDPALFKTITQHAGNRLAHARESRHKVPRQVLPALLPGILANGHIKRLRRAGYDPYALAPRPSEPARLIRLYWGAMLGRF